VICDYMKPPLRGRYPVQSPKSRVDINNIGSVMRILCSTAVLRAVSLVPGTNADTCEEQLSAARVKAVLNAAPTASDFWTASGPMWPPVLI
jgi:NADH/NAD ratio-sensing transcriptional regulator Rex